MNLSGYELDVVWSPGTTMHIADQLSRSVIDQQPSNHESSKIICEIDVEIAYNPRTIAASDNKIKELIKHTNEDPELISL